MIVECNHCRAYVDGERIARHESWDPEDPREVITYFLEYPLWKNPLLAGQYELEDDPPDRPWPHPRMSISWIMPDIIRHSFEETLGAGR
jgi:hypothetical protein